MLVAPKEYGAIYRPIEAKIFEAVSVQDFGAGCDGANDDALAINKTAQYCRLSGAKLAFPAGASCLISGTVDLSGVKVIDGRGAAIIAAFNSGPAVVIGGAGQSILEAAYIWLDVRSQADASSEDGFSGIKIQGLGTSKCYLAARGFNAGLYFDGASADRNWVDNEFNVISLYNNGSHVHFDLGGNSYAVANQFRGGRYYLGTNVKVADRGTFKINAAGAARVSEILVESPEIGISGGSAHATHAAFVQAALGTDKKDNSVFFRNARLEGYSAFSDDICAVRIANGPGEMNCDVEMASSSVSMSRLKIQTPVASKQSLSIREISNKTTSGTSQGQLLIPSCSFQPYQVNGRIYVPGRLLFNNGDYTTPVPYLTSGVGTVNVALGDERIVMSTSHNAVGHILRRSYTVTPQALFLKLLQRGRRPLVVVCYNSAGNVLSGDNPCYAVGGNGEAVTVGSTGIYRLSTDWLWIHPDVDHFFVGEAPWTGPSILRGLTFEQTFGSPLVFDTRKATARNCIGHSAEIQSYLPVGAAIDGVASNGNRATFFGEASLAAQANASDVQIDLSAVLAVQIGDRIGIELDQEIMAGLERRYHHTSIKAILSTTTIELLAPLPSAAAVGRRVLVNRWVNR